MQELHTQRCEACRKDAPKVDDEEARSLSSQIPSWRRESHDGVDKLIREFRFGNFREAFDFTSKIASLAEAEQHHPAITTEWGKVTVYWWTHKIKGLHINDYIMAARTDLIADSTTDA